MSPLSVPGTNFLYADISRKVVGKSACDNPEKYYEWFQVHCTSKKFERMTQVATDICLQVLKESNKNIGSTATVVKNSVLIISHTNVRDCRGQVFR